MTSFSLIDTCVCSEKKECKGEGGGVEGREWE